MIEWGYIKSNILFLHILLMSAVGFHINFDIFFTNISKTVLFISPFAIHRLPINT